MRPRVRKQAGKLFRSVRLLTMPLHHAFQHRLDNVGQSWPVGSIDVIEASTNEDYISHGWTGKERNREKGPRSLSLSFSCRRLPPLEGRFSSRSDGSNRTPSVGHALGSEDSTPVSNDSDLDCSQSSDQLLLFDQFCRYIGGKTLAASRLILSFSSSLARADTPSA